MQNIPVNIENFLQTIEKLRGADGCPWDKRQTFTSLRKYLRNETEELIEAVDKNDTDNICEEIGDILFVLLLYCQIGAENSLFSFQDVIDGVNSKLIFRHPHVFGDVKISSEEELHELWQVMKKKEKELKNKS